MTKDRTRRLELGKMLLDIAKYIVAIMVVGGFISNQISGDVVLLGIVLAVSVGTIGCLVIPLEEESK